MAIPVLMPKQGQSVESCIISTWYKKKGDKVEKGELLFSYETDKASFEEESPESGILLEVLYKEGDEVPVLSNVAFIGQAGETVENTVKTDDPTLVEKAVVPTTSKPIEKAQAIVEGKNIKISPLAKKVAIEKGIDPASINGTGPNGRIILRDIESVSVNEPKPTTTAKTPVPNVPAPNFGVQDYSDQKLTNIRKLIAASMHASLQNSAQLTHHLSADARKILALRNKVKEMLAKGYSENISLNDMICFAVIRALKKHPDANAHFLGESTRRFNKVHLGLAVDTERGLMVPTVRNADDYSLSGLSANLKAVAVACKNGSINPDLLSSQAASFTVSNLGNYGVEIFTPVINLPQVCILGVNTIIHRPALTEEGVFSFIPYLGLSLTYDHRAIDGGPATKLLAEIKYEIENFSVIL
jgi:pyruvate dehydrogenase E2 component (dihydrolipoamide acetyltransferase)